MVFIYFTKLTEHTATFISVRNSCKNFTVTGYETQSVIFASHCEKDFTESRDKTDNMINCTDTLKTPFCICNKCEHIQRHTQKIWWEWGVSQIQLRTEDRENGDLGR
jgi:hypothetical protein